MNVATAFIANKREIRSLELAFPFPAKKNHPKNWMIESEKNKYKREVKHK
jgi:hypothetical protein